MVNIISEPISSVEFFNQRDGFLFSPKEIQIWSVPIDASPELKKLCFDALTDYERERVPFFKFDIVQNNYIISQGILRLFLSKYFCLPTAEINVGRHKKGKPYSIDNTNLRFNMSNSGKRVVLAFSLDDEVGIDLESLRELDDLDELIEKNFTPAERAYINKVPEEKSRRFFKFWTIKEAYLKAIGEGMRWTPDNLEFSVENGAYKLQSVRGVFEPEDWLFEDFTLEDDYVGTLTYKGEGSVVTLRELK